VQGEDVLDGFEFEQNGAFDDDVGLVALVEMEAVEDERRGTSRWMLRPFFWRAWLRHWL
jgi:hypothetical protein